MHIPLSRYWSVLAVYLKPQRGKVLLLALLLLTGMGLQLYSPRIIRDFIDAVQAVSELTVMTRLALLFLGVAALKYMVALAQTYFSEDIGWVATNALRIDLTRHCLNLDMGFHNVHTPGALIERVDGDVSQLARFFSQLVISVLGNLLLLLGVLVTLFFEGWQIGLAFAAFSAVALVILITMRDFATAQRRVAREANANLFGFLEERLGGTEDIRANDGVAYTMHRLFTAMRTVWRADLAAAVRNAIFGSIISVWFSLGTVLALALGVILYQRGTVSLGTIYLLYAYVRMLNMPLTKLTTEFQYLQEASASLLRIDELLQTQPAIVDGKGSDLSSGPLTVAFEHVTFGYSARIETSNTIEDGGDIGSNSVPTSPILQDFSFQLPAGRTLGLLGRTGSGKSTITRLLLRLYDPQHGTIHLNGTDIRDLRLTNLLRHVSVVTQDVQIFDATVRDNLTFYDQHIDNDRIWSAINAAGLDDWFRQLPKGLETTLGAGNGLSAGEAQLLAFTRVFLKDPGLVILDEASARLDPATERHMDRAIDRLLAGRTAIVIAHRLESVQRVDDIMVLDGGRILEYGPRAQLAADPASHFTKLLRTGLDLDTEMAGGIPNCV